MSPTPQAHPGPGAQPEPPSPAPAGALRVRALLLLLSSAVAIYVGFLCLSPDQSRRIVQATGYYYIMGVFGAFLFYVWRVAGGRRRQWTARLGRPGWMGAGLLACWAFALLADPFKHKILFDEYVIQSTAFQMHASKEVGVVLRAYDIAGSWTALDTLLDKRPFFFPFLVSLLHDLTGYRAANAFVLNALLAGVALLLTAWLARTLAGPRPALLAAALLGTLPLFAQNATGAGMDLHNLTMILIVACLSVLYLRVPCEDRLCALVLGSVLLAESRYESILFALPVLAVILLGWRKAGRALLPWPLIAAPLMLMPYAWHNRVLSSMPVFWQLPAGRTSAFGAENILNNLEGAGDFLFNSGPSLANSWYLSVVGLAALGCLLVCGIRRLRAAPAGRRALTDEQTVGLVFLAGVAIHFGILLLYWWSRLDDVMASRFALPLSAAMAVAAAWMVRLAGDRGWPSLRLAYGGLALWFVVSGGPAISRRLYTDQNLVMQELDWERSEIATRQGPVLVIVNSSTIPFALWRIPTVMTDLAPFRIPQIRYHLKEGTFREVLVIQAIRPTTRDGDLGIDPGDVLPANFHLETIAEKRFGGRLSRISRLVALDPVARSPVLRR